MTSLNVRIPSEEELRNEVKAFFGYQPCLFQIKDALAQLQGGDTVTISATGSGKTLTFWIPLLFNDNGITIIITALNVLGDQNVQEVEKLGIKAVNVTGENNSDELFEDIAKGVYRVVVVGPEKILTDPRFVRLWDNKSFISRLFSISIDEAHCVSQWGTTFRPEYGELKSLRWRLPPHVRFHAVSATLPRLVFEDLQEKLNLHKNTTTVIRCSNDRPNIALVVEEMKHPASSFRDLRRVLQLDNRAVPPKFMVFLNKRRDAEKAVEEMWKELPQPLHHKIVWFHSGMSSHFKDKMIENLRKGDIWGLICTDAAGMGLDIPDIEVVIQLRYVGSLCTLMQRLGRGARGKGMSARGIYLVEPLHFDRNKKKKRQRGNSGNGDLSSHRKALRTLDNGRVAGKDRGFVGGQGISNEAEGARELNSHHGVARATSVGQGVINEEIGNPGEGRNSNAGATHSTVTTDCTDIQFPRALKSVSKEYEEDVMDLYINARERGFCRRAVCNKYFDNVQTEALWNECSCERCVYRRTHTSQVCCDACHPMAFTRIRLTELPPKAPRAKRKMNVQSYAPSAYSKKLKAALDTWRTEELAKEGFATGGLYGLQLIMSNSILQRIINLAHNGKLTSVAVLVEQTDWCEARKFGDTILKIVNDAGPAPSLPDNIQVKARTTVPTPHSISITTDYTPPTPHSSIAIVNPIREPSSSTHKRDERVHKGVADKENVHISSAPLSGGARSTRRHQCRKCGGQDHIASNRRLCPLWRSESTPQIQPTSVRGPAVLGVVESTVNTP